MQTNVTRTCMSVDWHIAYNEMVIARLMTTGGVDITRTWPVSDDDTARVTRLTKEQPVRVSGVGDWVRYG